MSPLAPTIGGMLLVFIALWAVIEVVGMLRKDVNDR
jgi:hypothetical protein